MKNFFLRLLLPFRRKPRIAIEILQNGKRIFGATVTEFESALAAAPLNGGLKAMIGKGLQLRVHDLNRVPRAYD